MNHELEQRVLAEIPTDDSAARGEKMLLYWLVRELQPKVVVETGTHKGLSALYMAAALRDNGFGHLTTYDPFEWGAAGNIAKFPELTEFVTYKKQKGSSMEEKNIDFAFIDGFHGEQDVIEEIESLLPRLSDVAVVVFHDCWYEEDGVNNGTGVNDALEKLHTVWLPTTNAIRIYSKHPERMTHRI